MAQFPETPVTKISNFQLKFLSKCTILFQILQIKMMILDTTNSNCRFSFKQYKLFYIAQKYEICPFMETMPHVKYFFTNSKLLHVWCDS